ncbi:hypothetical protein TNCV_4629971 [Trichonephila clavipes]|nr:hypothetical protein TNCV_4629971 [Trichonephila clavipes]
MRVIVANPTCLTMSDRGPRNSSRQRARCMSVVIRSFEHHTSDRYDMAQFHSNFEGENPGSGQKPLKSFPLPPASREDLRLDDYPPDA